MHERKPSATVGVERTSRRKRKKLDRLTRDAIAAQEAGMSYGKWKALHPHTPDEDDEEEQEITPGAVIANCEYCGEKFVKTTKAKRFCCATCQNRYNHEKRQREKKRAQPGKPAVCPICGADFMADYQHRIYCSSECYAESQRQKSKIWNARSREKRNTPNEKRLETDLDMLAETCQQCGEQFMKPEYQMRKRFCSIACKNAFRVRQEKARREAAKEAVEATCEHCGAKFAKSKNNTAKRFCSRTCQHRHTAKKRNGTPAIKKAKKEAAENGSI
jgi:endogenous inhibitor of DNA gyrase (YacG/DUF329 family)